MEKVSISLQIMKQHCFMQNSDPNSDPNNDPNSDPNNDPNSDPNNQGIVILITAI